MNRVAKVAAVVAACAVWIGFAILSSLDPADGATPSGPCVNRAERTNVEGVPRSTFERVAGVKGVEVRKLRDPLVYGMAYLTCTGRRVVVLYFHDGDTLASVLEA